MMPGVRKALAWAVLFIGGYNVTLPVVDEFISLPWVFTPIQVAHGVFLRDALLMLYIAIFGVVGTLARITLMPQEKRFAILVAALGFAGVLSAVINVTSIFDIGEALRLVLFAAYFCVAVDWASTFGSTFLLRTYLLGLATGGLINLYYTYQVQSMVLGILPFLLGQNGPGGFLGLSVVLAAWLMVLHRSRVEIILAVAVTAVGLFAASLSYSRLSMLQASCGVIAWLAVLIGASTQRGTKQRALAVTALAAVLTVGLATSSLGAEYIESVREFTERKFKGVDVRDANSVGTRYQYFWGVYDIFMAHPFVGVGYSGFYDAVVVTPTYRSGAMADEGVGLTAQRLANPHNAFLYYVSANGVIGLVLGPSMFFMFARALRNSLRPHKSYGVVVWLCIVIAYFINAMTLPTLFNTEVMYLAAAVAFVQQRGVRERRVTEVARPTWSAAAAY